MHDREAGGHGAFIHMEESELGEEAEHLVHYAHQLHLAAEAVEGGAHFLHKAMHFMKEAQAARKLLKVYAQMAFDLRRMRRGIKALENYVNKSGGGGNPIKAAQKLEKARKAYAEALVEFKEGQPAVREANEIIQEFKIVSSGLKGTAFVRLGSCGSTVRGGVERDPRWPGTNYHRTDHRQQAVHQRGGYRWCGLGGLCQL